MKKLSVLFALASMLAFASCEKAEQAESNLSPEVQAPVFTASIAKTKTSINNSTGKVSWVAGDEITVTGASGSAIYLASTGGETVSFTIKDGEISPGEGPYTAVYEGLGSFDAQTYSDVPGNLPMSAPSTPGTDLTFDVTAALMDIALTKDGESISSVVVSDGTNTYTLNCPSPVDISSETHFYVALPAGGYNIFSFTNSDGKVCTKTKKSGTVDLVANQIQPISFSTLAFTTMYVSNATELDAALTKAVDGDKIILAAGTYTAASTFNITKSLTLEGGHSASPTLGETPDPATYKAILDGNSACRVMNINASGKTVNLSGLVLQNGKAEGTANGGGLLVTKGNVKLDYVNILDNVANMGGGFVVTGANSIAIFTNCIISGNKPTGNGSNYIYDGGEASFEKCVFSGNSSAMGGALYVYSNNSTKSITISVLNCEFYNNSATGGRGGAIYARANSSLTNNLYIANSTFYENSSTSYGGAIDVYGTVSAIFNVDVFSSTFTNNNTSNVKYGGTVTTETDGQIVNIYNSIVSGNTSSSTQNDLNQVKGKINSTSTISGGTASDYIASSASTKDGYLTKAYKVKTAATTAGMDVVSLKAAYTGSDDDFKAALGFDQWGATRSGITAGACVTTE